MKYKIITNEIRRKWLDFFKSKNHLEVESKSLIPIDDDSLLWINSGVATLKKFFSGKENPPSNRLVNSQKCIRTNDIENIGITSRHHTFFEMLGNFSIGDYFRKEAIEFASEFLLKVLNIDPKLLYITVYENDLESYELWVKNGFLPSHIVKCGKERNFWEIGAGPCGPCTEIYYDRGEKFDFNNLGEKLFFEDIENDRYIEIWNIVFSEFENDGKNNYQKLSRQNIDTGAGLERLACILQGVNTNYDTDGFVEPRNVLEKFSKYKYDNNLYFETNKNSLKVFINKSFVVIIDHIKACLFAISDGAMPSNKDRGYVLRKLLRRSFFYMDFLSISSEAIKEVIDNLVLINSDYYSYLMDFKEHVINTIYKEYDSYKTSLKNSLNVFVELLNKNEMNEHNLFKLVDTYGFPLEIVNELIESNNNELKTMMIQSLSEKQLDIDIRNLKINYEKFNEIFDNHRLISKGNKSVSGIESQNHALMKLETDFYFDYNSSLIENSKVVKIYTEDFNEINDVTNSNCFVVLDKTCIYATSGGQEHDLGYIDNFFVDDAIKNANGIHIHHVIGATLKVRQIVKVRHDVNVRKKTRIHHSSEHLLHSALKNEISISIKQEGALKNSDKFTFDFYYPKKLTYLEIIKLEENIKKVISKKINSNTTLCSLQEAQEKGALAYFSDVYKKIKGKLRVVQLSENSIEVCGGTHVPNTEEIYDFKIIGLTSKGSGSWRIEAISGQENIENFNNTIYKKTIDKFNEFKKFILNAKYDDKKVFELLHKDEKSIHYLELKTILDELNVVVNIIQNKELKNNILNQANELKKVFLDNEDLIFFVDNIDRKVLTTCLMNIVNELNKFIFVFNKIDGSYQYILCANDKKNSVNLNDLSKELNEKFNGKGGGRNNFVQGNIKSIDNNLINSICQDFINDKK